MVARGGNSNVESSRFGCGVLCGTPTAPQVRGGSPQATMASGPFIKISGPVRPFFLSFCPFWGISSACWRAVVGFGCVGRLGGLVWALSGALKPTVGATVGARRPGGGAGTSRTSSSKQAPDGSRGLRR